MKTIILVMATSIALLGSYKCIGQTVDAQNVNRNDQMEITQPKDFPLIFRRTTLIVRDIEKSLELYKDIMGMEVIYDNKLTRPHKEEDRDQIVRLIFLKATSNFNGVLGLIEYDYDNTNKTLKPIRKEGFTAQNTILLFNSNDQDARLKEIKKLPTIEMIKEPRLIKYPSYNGGDPIKAKVAIFYDPDGYIVEFNKLLDNL